MQQQATVNDPIKGLSQRQRTILPDQLFAFLQDIVLGYDQVKDLSNQMH